MTREPFEVGRAQLSHHAEGDERLAAPGEDAALEIREPERPEQLDLVDWVARSTAADSANSR